MAVERVFGVGGPGGELEVWSLGREVCARVRERRRSG